MSRALRFAWSAVVVALGALRRSPMRAALTAFGVAVGVAAVTVGTALGEGASDAISKTIDTLGTNKVTVRPRSRARSGLRDAERPEYLTEGDARALALEGRSITHAAPVLSTYAQLVWRDNNVATRITGSTTSLFPVRDWKPSRGSIWKEADERVRERVCLIGQTTAETLFGATDPVGRIVRIGRHPFQVMGVLEKKGQTMMGRDQDDVVVMPITTLRAKLLPTRPGQVHQIILSASSATATDRAVRQATAILRQRHSLAEGAPNDFRIYTQEEQRKTQEEVLGVLRLLLLCVALVSLVVGGIGVMNIMLVSVAERTREIGVRLAIGARQADILAQFLVEAVVLSVLGGLVGAILAGGGIVALADALDLPMRISPEALGVALATSSAVGLTFGFLPARRAALLDPIVALNRQ